jgi:hypothetical protein
MDPRLERLRDGDSSFGPFGGPQVAHAPGLSPRRTGRKPRGCGSVAPPVVGIPPHHPAGDAPAARKAGTPLNAFSSPPDCLQLRHHSPNLANRTGAKGDGPEGEGQDGPESACQPFCDFDSRLFYFHHKKGVS